MSDLDPSHVRRYLLGQMSEDETDALEGEYFADPQVLEQVWDVENDLVDAYVAGELRPEERSAFEGHYLSSPVHRDRVASARALRSAAGSVATSVKASWTPWLALAAALLMVAAGWWIGRQSKTPPVAEAPRPTPELAAATPMPTETPSLTPTPSAGPGRVVAAFALSPVLLRGDQGTPVLRVAPGTEELALKLEGGRPESIASDARLPFVVRTVEGDTVADGYVVARRDSLGVARIAAARVPPGDYILALYKAGAGNPDEPLRQYFFRVLRP